MIDGVQQRNGSASRRIGMGAALAALLLVPLIAMQFTDQVQWTAFDFAVAGALLFGAMAAYEIAARRFQDRKRRAMVGAALVSVVLLLWAEGAVGIF